MDCNDAASQKLRAGLPAVWLRPATATATNQTPIQPEEIRAAQERLEPSAASGFAAVSHYLNAAHAAGVAPPNDAVHVVWTTGGSQLPEDQFSALLRAEAQ